MSKQLAAFKENSDQAVPFIIYSAKDGFKLNPEAEEYLRTLDPNRKVAVISIVGKYRTGKSFLVNRVLLNKKGKKAGFSVGPTINPCTKGLWLWRECLQSDELEEDVDVILLDTEGFGGMDENTTHDSRIFLFSLLLSSFFIYNSQGNIDETALNNISLIINLSKDIKISSETNSEQCDPADYFPSFLWVVRDFALQMVDKEGKKITSKDYLEKALENQKGVSDAVEQKNKIRRQLKHFFKDRDCFTLVRPIESEADLQRVNEMNDSELRPEFVAQAAVLRKKIFRKMKPKMINGRNLSGIQLLEICKAYIEAINKGTLPNIENAWKYMCQNESKKAIEESLKLVIGNLHKKYLSDNGAPLSADQLHHIKAQMREEAMRLFKQKSIGSDEELREYYEKLDIEFGEHFKEFKNKNTEKMKLHYDELVGDCIAEIERKLRNDEYSHLQEFESELNDLKKQFEGRVGCNQESSDYWKQLREGIYKSAVDKIGIKMQRQKEKEMKIMEQRVQMQKEEMDKTKDTWEKEKQKLIEKIQALEREKAQWTVGEQFREEKLKSLTEEKNKLENVVDQLRQTNDKIIKESQGVNQEKYQTIQKQLEEQKSEGIKSSLALEKQNALLEQENKYKQKEITRLQESNDKFQNQFNKQQQEQSQLQSTVNQLKQQLNQVEVAKRHEIEQIKSEYSKQMQSAASKEQSKQDANKQQQESIAQKNYLETQVQFLQNQLDENKRLHDALLLALQQGIQQQQIKEDGDISIGSNSSASLIEQNKSLIISNEKLQQQVFAQSNKIEKLKTYKKLIKNSTTIQCICCSKFIPSRSFQTHLESCELSPTLPSSLNQHRTILTFKLDLGKQQQPQFTKDLSASIPSTYLTQSIAGVNSSFSSNQQKQPQQQQQSIEVSQLQILINQTIVKESSDHKPYTQYIMSVNYLNQISWKLQKKYKNFCELHHALATQFSGMKFPESSLAIINSSSENSSTSQNKKPAYIEERRKALQQYIRDLNNIECVRNSKVFRNFLEFDSHTLNVSSLQKPAPSSTSFMACSFLQSNTQNNEKENEQKMNSSSIFTQQQSQQAQYLNSLVGSLQPQQTLQQVVTEKRGGGNFVEAWQNKENKQKNINSGRSKSMTAQQEQQFQFGGGRKSEQMIGEEEDERQQEEEEEDNHNYNITQELSPTRSPLPNSQRNNLGGSYQQQQRQFAQSLSSSNSNLLIQKSPQLVPLSSVSRSQTYTYNFIKTQQHRSPVQHNFS